MNTIMFREISEQNETLIMLRNYYIDKAKDLHNELSNYNRVYLMGTGASLQACYSSLPCFLLNTAVDVQVVGACDNTKITRIANGDLVILVSQSGNSLETRIALDKLHSQKVKVWGLCNDDTSYLWKNTDRQLPVFALNETGSATKSYSGSVYALYYIACGQNEGLLDLLKVIIDDNKETLEIMPEQAKKYATELRDRNILYIAGIEDSGPVAIQASIVLKEKTFMHVSGMPISEFRHGTVEVVTPGLPVILVAIGDKEYELALKHQQYLASIEADCLIVSDQKNADVHFINSLPAEFGMINAQVFFQYLAEAIAVIRKLDVDNFKFLSKVVDKY